MAGFEFTADGIRPFDDTGLPAAPAFVDPREVAEAAKAVESIAVAHAAHASSVKPVPLSALTPRDVVNQARARIRELRASLRQAKRWERELNQLTRLIAAATGKPLAPVRAIENARRTG